MIYAQPGSDNAVVNFKAQYDNFIGGEWVKPVSGEYFDNILLLTVRLTVKWHVQQRRILA